MPNRARQIIEQLELEPHPEGGYFKEIFRSPTEVQPSDERTKRNALTVIYFLLQKGEISKWHRVRSDEAWHFLEGGPLRLYLMDDEMKTVEQKLLASHAAEYNAVEVVPANVWQAAECIGDYSLVSCSVGPGFDFEDFEMVRDQQKPRKKLKKMQSDFMRII